MILRFARRFDQLGDNMGGRRQIWITHAEIDDVFAPTTRLHFHTVDDAENIGWQPFDSLKFHELLPHALKLCIVN